MIMNKELLKLFNINDDTVDDFSVDNKNSFYVITVRFKPSSQYCPNCGSIHFCSVTIDVKQFDIKSDSFPV